MTRSWYKTLIALLWVAPVALGIRYRQIWDRLPIRMASHFDAAGRANGWMTRDAALYFDLAFLVFLAAIFSVVLYLVQGKYELAKISWALLVFLHLEIWTFVYLLNSTLDYNLVGSPISILPLTVVSVLGGIVVAAFALGEKRGIPLSASEVLAEEVHSGKKLAVFFLVPLAVLAAISLSIPNATARFALSLVAVITVATYAMAWDGFHYYFTRHGVEIRTLGFRLKSIPLLQIKDYEIQNWNALRGFGIRGVGHRKAYVWGRTGVRVEMYDGEVFLGHNDPQRIVHDLNVIKRYQQS
ncbi:MAG: DUF1648 domain-containing protein [Candidatus Sulfotelmatobacter sp.]